MSDEQKLWNAFPLQFQWPRDAGHHLGIPPKRVIYLCKKWAKQGIYEYGVSCDLGWKIKR